MNELHPVEKFRFVCHPGVECFNECCKNLNLALTPYDVLRISRELDMTTAQFLEKYTTWHVGMATGLPVVILKMQNGRCPFVTENGCSIYRSRPTPCRLYPLVRARTGENEHYFLLEEEFCKGHGKGRWWSVEEWLEDQEVKEYNKMNDLFFELISAKNRVRRELSESDLREIYTACFDIDGLKFSKGIQSDVEALVAGIRLAIQVVEGKEEH